MIIPMNLAATSKLDGFKNYQSSSFSVTIPAQIIAAGDFVSYTAQTLLQNDNSISQVQVQYDGLSDEYYVMNGIVNTFWNSGDFSIQSYYYFDTDYLYVFSVIVNQTAAPINVPDTVIRCRGFSFIAPF